MLKRIYEDVQCKYTRGSVQIHSTVFIGETVATVNSRHNLHALNRIQNKLICEYVMVVSGNNLKSRLIQRELLVRKQDRHHQQRDNKTSFSSVISSVYCHVEGNKIC
jgi:hypothetical protein